MMTVACRSKQALASLVLAFAGCVLWISINNNRIPFLEHQNHRSLYSLLDEDEAIPTLFPFRTVDYIGFFCAVAGLVLAAGAGIGGGGILVPIFILIFEFPVKHSIPLASVTVLGGALANNLLNARKKHADGFRPLIDWDLMIQLEPMTMAGALVGADLNDWLSDVVLVVLLFLLLSATAYKTLQKAHKLHQKETEVFLSYRGLEESTKLLASSTGSMEDFKATSYGDDPEGGSEGSDSEPLMRAQGLQIRNSMMELTTLFLIVTVLNLLKGGPEEGGGPAGMKACGAGCYWITEAGIMVLIVAFAAYERRAILNRIESGGIVLSDIHWDERNTLVYPLYAIVAGLVAGMFGVGGGIIKGPLMLALGVNPQVASATSACMILFTSTTATVSYMIFDLLIYDYAAGCLATGFLATLLGQTLMSMIMKKYNRNSYIAYTISFVVGLSAIAMTAEAILAIWG